MKSLLVQPLKYVETNKLDIRTILEKNSDQEFTHALEKYNTEQLLTFKTSGNDRRVMSSA
jgi:hypothetical protein